MINLDSIGNKLAYLKNKLKKPQEYRYVRAIDEEKEIYVGMTVELLSKEYFEKEYME